MRKLSEVIGVLFLMSAVIGYILNLVAVFRLPVVSLWTGFDVMRVIGVFIPPLGAITGYF